MSNSDERLQRRTLNALKREKTVTPGFLREGAVLTSFTIVSKILGFIREWLVAFFFGAGIITDALRIATGISSFFWNAIIGQHVETSIIPLLTRWRTIGNRHSVNLLFKSIASISMIISVFIALLMIIFADWFVKIQAPAFGLDQAKATAALITWIAPSVPLFIGINLLGYLLSSVHRFRKFTIVPLMINIGMISAIIYVGKFGGSPIYLSIGYCITLFVIFLMLLIDSRPWWPGKSNISKQKLATVLQPFMKNWMPLMILALFLQSKLFIDKRIVSDLTIGAVASLGYAHFIIDTPFSTAGTALIRIVLPRFSEMVAKKRIDEVARQFLILHEVSLWLLLPAVIILTLSSTQFVQLIFGYGAFDLSAVKLTAAALTGFAPLLWIRFIYPLIHRIYNAEGRNHILLQTGSIGTVITVIIALLLVGKIGIKGVALATSIGELLITLSLFPMLPEKIGKSAFKTFFTWGFLAVIVYYVVSLIPVPPSNILSILLVISCTLIIWIPLSLILPSGRANFRRILDLVNKKG